MTNPVPLLIVLSAPSGGGKTTLCHQLLATDAHITRAVTCTTRPPRPGEKDGIDYYFLDAETFLKRVQAGHFLEHATVWGNSYGTLKSEILEKLRSGKDVLLSVDFQGVESICDKAAEDEDLSAAMVTVFLTPENISVLEARLRKRNSDSEEQIQKRLSGAREEISHWRNFQYLIISTTIEEDLRRMQAIIEAEKMRSIRAPAPPC